MTSPRARTAVDWLSRLPEARIVAGEPGRVTAVCNDSRRVVPGALFVAVPGFDSDGHRYLRDALERGATALLVQEDRRALWEPLAGKDAAVVAVADARWALARAAAGFYGRPATKLGVVGVTGTDGKTTTVHLTAKIIDAAFHSVPRTGLLSSVGFCTDGFTLEPNASHMTTLEAPFIQAQLARMVDNVGIEGAERIEYAVIEASSHGLALHRVDECAFDVAVFTNLSSDHLDFHGTLDDYRDAKGCLFRMLDESPPKESMKKAAILNADDPASEFFRTLTSVPVLTYGIEKPADLRATGIRMTEEGVHFKLQTTDRRVGVETRLFGLFNVYNCLAAAAVGLSQGWELDALANGFRDFHAVPGHLELIECGQAFRVVVDIASTPNAMQRVLEVLRPVTEGRLCVVFGAAGERDPARRDGIGRVVGELGDFAVITNEDPRREDPDAIIEQIAAGVRGAGREEGRDFARVPDRREAIGYAFERARPGDTVLLAGKGTEPSIEMAGESIAWDEGQVARELLVELAKGA